MSMTGQSSIQVTSLFWDCVSDNSKSISPVLHSRCGTEWQLTCNNVVKDDKLCHAGGNHALRIQSAASTLALHHLQRPQKKDATNCNLSGCRHLKPPNLGNY